MDIPNKLEISPTNLVSLDERTAYEHFHGKTIGEAVKLFRETEHVYVDDLAWMGEKAFDYYLDAYIIHLKESPKQQVDVCLAMHLVVIRTEMNRATKKIMRLVETIEVYRKPLEPCPSDLISDYEKAISEMGAPLRKVDHDSI